MCNSTLIYNEHLKTINSSWDFYIDERHDFSDISQENIDKFIQKVEKNLDKTFNDDPMTILRKYELIKENKLTFASYLLFTLNNSPITSLQIGRFKDPITIEKLQSGNYSSRTRNRAIANAFKEAGIIERYGSGIQRIKDECRVHGVIEPTFEEFVHGFRVTLYKGKLSERVNVGVNEVFKYIEQNQPIKANKIAEYFSSVTQRTIERWLKQLKDENKIEFKGSPKMGGYTIK